MTIATRQMYPSLDAATEAALRASIERFGVLVPPVVDQHGEIIDGHHRSRIAAELGVTFDVTVRHVADEDEAREIARTLNEDRRMLTREQRREQVVFLHGEVDENGVRMHSQRAIAGALKVSRRTVQKDLGQVATCSHLITGPLSVDDPTRRRDRYDNPAAQSIDYTKGLDGKTYPASRPATGRSGTKSIPVALDTARQRQIADTAKERIERAVGTCNGIARGFDHLNVEAALLRTTDEEIAGWHEALRDATTAIKRLQTRLREGHQA